MLWFLGSCWLYGYIYSAGQDGMGSDGMGRILDGWIFGRAFVLTYVLDTYLSCLVAVFDIFRLRCGFPCSATCFHIVQPQSPDDEFSPWTRVT